MKTCRQCSTSFPAGLTCPSCHAFVPDVEVGTSAGSGHVHGPRPRTGRPTWTGAAPQAPAADAPATDAPSWTRAAVPTPAPAPAPAPIPTAPATSTPSLAAPAAAPDPMASLRARAEERARGPLVPPPRDVAAAAGPSWTRVAPGAMPTATQPVPAAPAAPAGRAPRRVLIPLAAGAAVVALIVVALAVVVLRPSPPAGGPIATDIVGTCITYTADRAQVGAAVPCDQSHDGKVLASVADRTGCPAGTTDILTTADDVQASGGVLCVAKPT